MALLALSGTPAKNSTVTLTLDKVALLQLVATDTFWSAPANIESVSVIFKSSVGGQEKKIKLGFSHATPSAGLHLSSKARGNFQLHKILIHDFDSGYVELSRSDILAAYPTLTSIDFDVDSGATPPPAPSDTTAPTPGTAISFSNLAATSVTVNWGAATDSVTAQASLSYKLVKSSSANLGSVSAAESNGTVVMDWTANTLSASATGLSEASTVHFAVIVKDAAGNKALYTSASTTTLDATAPTVGTGILLSSITASSMAASWGAATDNSTAQASLSYKLVRSTSNNLGSVADAEANGTTVMDWTANTLSASATGLAEATTHYFAVIVRDATGNKALYSSVNAATLDATAPTPGAAISFSNVGSTSLTASWGAATDSVTAQADLSYKLVRSTSNNLGSAVLAEANGITVMDWTTNTLTANVTGLTAGTTYYFAVIVRDAAGNKESYAAQSAATSLWSLNAAGGYTVKFGGGVSANAPALTTLSKDSSGNIFAAGGFYYETADRGAVVKLSSNGLLDRNWSGAFTTYSFGASYVTCSAVDSSGRLYLGGSFSSYNGNSNQKYLIRLNSDGSVDSNFSTNILNITKSTVSTVAIQSDGKILVGGIFTSISGVSGRNYVARLNSDGTLDTTFSTNAVDGSKFSVGTGLVISVQSDGKILVGGAFTNYGGTAGRNSLVRLNSDGTLDASWTANASDSSKLSAAPVALVPQSDGKVIVGGNFTNYGGTSGRNRLVRLNSDGTTDTAFCANASDGSALGSTLSAVALDSSGNIYLGGTFSNYKVSGNNYLVKLNSSGVYDSSFASAVASKISTAVRALLITNSNEVLAGGTFYNWDNREYPLLVALNSDGTINNTFSNNASRSPIVNDLVRAVATDSSDRIVVSGDFTSIDGTLNRNYMLRYLADGSLDSSFTQNASAGNKFSVGPVALAAQSDGKVLVGGAFLSYNGRSGRRNFIRLDADGLEDASFCSNATDGSKFNGSVNAIAIQSDGKILVGGAFSNYAAVAGRNRLIRLNADGALDSAFCANAADSTKFSDVVYAVKIQPDGKILVGGAFDNYAGTTNRNCLIRLNSDGTVDSSFCANATDSASKFTTAHTVRSIAIQSDGKILVGGQFTNYGGVTGRNRLIRLNSDGTIDASFCANATDSNSKFNNDVVTVSVDSAGKILAVGTFTYLNLYSTYVLLNSDGTVNSAMTSNANRPLNLSGAESLGGSSIAYSSAKQTVPVSKYGPIVKVDSDLNIL